MSLGIQHSLFKSNTTTHKTMRSAKPITPNPDYEVFFPHSGLQSHSKRITMMHAWIKRHYKGDHNHPWRIVFAPLIAAMAITNP